MGSIAVFKQNYTSATHIPNGIVENPLQASGSADALPIATANIFVTTAGVDAMTLATPKAGVYPSNVPSQNPIQIGDDGKVLLIVDTTGHAHTITTAADKIAPSHDTLTFNGTVGSYVELIAFGGLWYIIASSGVAASEV